MSRSRILQDRLSFLGYDGHCRENLKELQALLAPAIDGLLDEFYAFMRTRPETRDLLPTEEILMRARNAHKEHWLEVLFGSELGEAHRVRTIEIGHAHERIGLGLSAYLGGYCIVLNRFVELIASKYQHDAQALAGMTQSIHKAVFLDIDFVIESYLEAKNASIRKILRNAEQFIAEVERIDGELATLGRRLPPQTEALSKNLETSRERLERLADTLAQSKQSRACMQQLERLREAIGACEESVIAIAGHSQIVSQQLDRLNTEVATRKTNHRLNFGAPPPQSFLSRLRQAARVLFPAAPG
jgi:hypothetical protein